MLPAPLPAQAPPACEGRTITEVEIRARPPYPEGLLRRLEPVVAAVDALHVTTRTGVVRRYLAFHPGEPCSPLRLAESERILRTQPFIADATITAVPDGDGVRIEVETIDEISLTGGMSASADSPYLTAFRLGDRNVLGGGLELIGEWRSGFFYRDTWGGQLVHRQILGRPYDLTIAGARRTHGDVWIGELRHAFLTDLQRLAWRAAGGSTRELHSLLREPGAPVAIQVERQWADVGGVIRVGLPGRLSLFGASLSREFEATSDRAVMISDSGLVIDESVNLDGRFERHRMARVNALWGVRAIRFMRVTGFDALSGAQDVRKGFQLGTMLGRSLSVLGSEDDDIIAAADLYVGGGTPRVFAGMQVHAEGRQDYDENRWDGILGSGRTALYGRLTQRHTLVASAEWSGGWRQRTPFQLTLGDRDGGVRGHGGSPAGGARRVVVRIEERWRLGRPLALADVGVAMFADGGRLWAGDAMFGVSTEPRFGVGAGLLLAVPPQSRHLWRLDIAVPVGPHRHGVEVRLSSRDISRAFWREPSDVVRNRERILPASVFSWP
ncbi:MAG TPA: hypothetical protein VMM18_07930 [Gemmatimonadaceae bacterium]|nr:hypothetical protein [Gemmatimonadaceae bacterium]